LATGLLLICTGKFTKNIEQLQAAQKEYTGTITLGATTPSYDLETEVDATYPINHITKESIDLAASSFVGEIEQRPPIFSALKKDGKRLYEYARAGQEITIKKRKVSIMAFEITQVDLPDVAFRISCGKGTYIRSLAHDFGIALGSGGHLSALRRTKIGDYIVNNAMDPNAFADILLQNDNIP
jgi:tRNA pseudouridine55 synthase